MKNQNKTKLWQFDVPLYPRKLWVAVGDDPKTISRKLTISDATKEVLSNAIAITTTARDKDQFAGVLVWIICPKETTPGVVAHESLHALDYIMNYVLQHVHKYEDPNEPDAHLLEWIVDTITECLTKYRKK